jgi:hypothetical protein
LDFFFVGILFVGTFFVEKFSPENSQLGLYFGSAENSSNFSLRICLRWILFMAKVPLRADDVANGHWPCVFFSQIAFLA